jgi:hypothetical protein
MFDEVQQAVACAPTTGHGCNPNVRSSRCPSSGFLALKLSQSLPRGLAYHLSFSSSRSGSDSRYGRHSAGLLSWLLLWHVSAARLGCCCCSQGCCAAFCKSASCWDFNSSGRRCGLIRILVLLCGFGITARCPPAAASCVSISSGAASPCYASMLTVPCCVHLLLPVSFCVFC